MTRTTVPLLGTLADPIAVVPLKKVTVPVATCNGTFEPTDGSQGYGLSAE